MPTLKFCCGGECNLAGIGTASGGVEHWSGLTGSGQSISTATVHPGGGSRSLRFNPSSATSTLEHVFASAVGSPATIVARFYFNVGSYTALSTAIFLPLNGATALGAIQIRDTGGGLKIRTRAGANTFGTEVDIVTGRWYRVDVKIVSGATMTCDAMLDGVALGQATEAGAASACDRVRFGSNTSGTIDLFFDHLVVSGTSGDYPLGGGAVAGLYPSADGTHGGGWASGVFGKSTGGATAAANTDTTLWQNLDNPLVLTAAGTWLSDLTGVALTNYIELVLDNLPAGAATAAINGVMAVATSHSATTTANNLDLRLADSTGGAAASFISVADLSETTITAVMAMLAADRSGNAWTYARVNDVRIRFSSTDSNPDVYLDGVMLEVDYQSIDIPISPAVATAQAVALTVTPGAVTPAITPADVTAAAVALGITLVDPSTSLPLTPAVVTAAAVALAVTPVVAVALTPAVVTAAAVALAPSPGGVDLLLVDWSLCGGGFSPDDIAGLVAWYDASDLATITASGSPAAVSQWDDKSVSGDAATNATGGTQPATGTRTLNGLDVIEFNWSDQNDVLYPALQLASDDSASLFVVVVNDQAATQEACLLGAESGGFGLYFGNGFARAVRAGVTDIGTHAIAAANGVPYVVAALNTGAAGDIQVRVNGAGTSTDHAVTLSGGKRHTIGKGSDNNGPLDGCIAEVLCYDSSLSDADRDAVEAYLTDKWLTFHDPSNVEGLIAAWDFSDTSTITESGGAVSQVDGAYGTSMALVQATGSAQPTTGTRTQNGLNVLDFDGSGDYLATASVPAWSHVFIVAQYDGAAFADWEGVWTNSVGSGGVNSTGIGLGGQSGSARWYAMGPCSYRKNGVPFDVAGAEAGSGPMNAYGVMSLSVASPVADWTVWQVGKDRSNARYWNGAVTEVLVYDNVLSTADRNAIEAFLMDKWGV